jgi:hypothetical protein
MKKFLAFMMVAAAVLFVAGNANAAFSNGDLIEVIVDTNGNEYAQDLGALNTSATGNLGTALALSGTALASDITAGKVSVEFFSYSTNGAGLPVLDVWAASQPTVASWAKMTSTGSTTPSNIGSYFNWTGSQSFTNGWYSVGQATTNDFTSALGATYAAFINGTGAVLSTSMNTTLKEYVFTGGTATTGRTVSQGTLALTISDANDTNTFQASGPAAATPIPPSVLLFGSGLLGLIGLKRRS